MVDFVKFKKDKEDGKESKRRGFSIRNLILITIAFLILSSIISGFITSVTPKIAVIPINGPIMTEETFSIYGSSISSRNIANKIYSLNDDSSVKAILLDINSPGGSPVASEEISKAIENVEVPVYALISDTGASGAYWIAASTDKIFASSMSAVGSIGVTSAGLSFEDFIREYNITYRKQTAGEFKDMGSPFREPTPEEEEKIQNILNEVHENFINHIATGRNMSYEDVKPYATGEIFLGSTALEYGLIDEIGYYPNVIQDLKNAVGNNDTLVVDYGPAPTLMEELGFSTFFNWKPNTKSQVLLQ